MKWSREIAQERLIKVLDWVKQRTMKEWITYIRYGMYAFLALISVLVIGRIVLRMMFG